MSNNALKAEACEFDRRIIAPHDPPAAAHRDRRVLDQARRAGGWTQGTRLGLALTKRFRSRESGSGPREPSPRDQRTEKLIRFLPGRRLPGLKAFGFALFPQMAPVGRGIRGLSPSRP